MNKKMKAFLKNRAIKNKTDIKLKDLFLRTNKEDIITFAIKYIHNKKAYELDYNKEEFEKSKLNDMKYLSDKYDYFLDLCKNDYSNELSNKYVIDDEFNNSLGFGKFLSILNTEKYLEDTGIFFKTDYNKPLCPIELLLDCYIMQGVLNRYKEHVVIARFLLQVVFIEEKNELRKKIATN